jgi:hypothetical protein
VSTSQTGARLAPSLWRWDRLRVLGRVDVRIAVAACFLLALAAYGVESIAWPLREGRDGTTYLMYYRDMWNAHPAYPELMLFRTPLAPLLLGAPLQLGGAVLLEIVLGVAYALSVTAYALAASAFGSACAVVVAVALLVYPPYAALFHQASSDPVFAFVLALWTLGAVRTAQRPSLARYGLLGVGTLALVLARPSSQLFLLFAVVPLVLAGAWRARALRAAAFAAAAAAALVAWAGYNSLRYGDFVVSRTGSADVPFYRVFVLEKAVSPDNGPASRELAAAVKRDLLPAYRGQFTVRTFFSTASDRMWNDLVVLSDRRWGWNSDYAILRKVALETIESRPRAYLRDVASAVRIELDSGYAWTASVRPAPAPSAPKARAAAAQAADPNDPGGILWWLASTPDGHIRPVPNGLVWTNPGGQAHAAWLKRSVQRLESDLPNRSGSTRVATLLNDWAHGFPRMTLWLVLGLAALLVRRPRGWRLPSALALLGLVVVVATVAGMPPGIEYRLPFDPLFVLFAAAAVTLPRPVRARRALPWLGR